MIQKSLKKYGSTVFLIFLILTLVSSIFAVPFTGNIGIVLAKKHNGSSSGGGSSNKDKGSGGSSDNGGASGGSNDNGGGGGTTTTEKGGGSNSDTSNTSPAQAPTNQQTCPDGSTPDDKGNCPKSSADNSAGGITTPPPPATTQQKTCPDGSTPDLNGNCPSPASNPATTLSPNQGTTTTTTPAAQDGGHILVMPNGDGTCPTGSHKFPGSQVCEKDMATPSSSGGVQMPPECQGIIAGPKDKCSLGTNASPTSINGAPLTHQQQYEQCLQGIGGSIPGNCKPPSSTTTEQNAAPLQTLTPQQTCKDGSMPDTNGNCKDGSTPQQTCSGDKVLDAKGDCLSPGDEQSIKNGTLIPLGNGKFRLATAPPVPNTNSIAPICPVGFHLALSKCVVNSGGCPEGTVQDDDMCSPSQAHYNIPTNVDKLQDGTCPSGYHSTDVQCEINSQQKLSNGMCPFGTVLTTDDRCVTLPVLPGSKTGSGGGFIQMIPQKTTPASPPATSPNQESTPPTQPSQPKQLAPSQTLTQQTCPPLPIDANGKCPGIDARGGGLGLPPPPCENGYTPDAKGNCVDMRGGGLELPPVPPQAHYNIPSSVAKLDDGSCPSRYHSNSDADQQCEIDSQPKLNDGRCPDGTILTNDEKCVLPPVLPGSTTGGGGGFIQMLPTKPG